MSFKSFRKPEIVERAVPALFLLFAWRLFGGRFFEDGVYAFTVWRDESFWLIVFLIIGTLTVWTTEINVRDVRIFSELTRWRLRIISLVLCFLAWCPWALGLLRQGRAGFGDIIWTGLAVMTGWLAVRIYKEPFTHAKK